MAVMMMDRTVAGVPGTAIPSAMPSATTGPLAVPRCTIKVEKCTGGCKITCACDDDLSCATLQNLCKMCCDGLCSLCCTINGSCVCQCNMTMCHCNCECTKDGVCITCTSGDAKCCAMVQACCECIAKCLECGCQCCVCFNNTPVCCGTC